MKYLIIHQHEYGISRALFATKDINPELLEENELIALLGFCGLNFEPSKTETADIILLDDTECHPVSKEDINIFLKSISVLDTGRCKNCNTNIPYKIFITNQGLCQNCLNTIK